MADLYTGKYLIIHDKQSLSVGLRRGLFGRKVEWHRATPAVISINTYHMNAVNAWTIKRVPIEGLSLNLIELSHVLGVSRLDRERADELTRVPDAIRGEHVFVSSAFKEMTTFRAYTDSAKGTTRYDTGLVYPFSSVREVELKGSLRLVLKWEKEAVEVGQFPLPPGRLAELLGVPFIEYGGAGS